MHSPDKKGFDSPEIKKAYFKRLHEIAEHPEIQERKERINELLDTRDYHADQYNALAQQYKTVAREKTALNEQKVRLNLRLENEYIDEREDAQSSAALGLSYDNKKILLEELKAEIQVRDMLMETYDEQKEKHVNAIKLIDAELVELDYRDDRQDLTNIDLN